jgi:hypothetical protein
MVHFKILFIDLSEVDFILGLCEFKSEFPGNVYRSLPYQIKQEMPNYLDDNISSHRNG